VASPPLGRRNWKSFLGDVLLQALSGGFLGLIYLGQPYEGGLTEFEYNLCVQAADATGGQWQDLCRLPRHDPLIGEASLCILALSLGAMISSLRVFGAEKVIFTR
jgi:hypothetical protein